MKALQPLVNADLRASLRFLVKPAVKCDSAEELGKRLKRRYQRQQLRQRTAASLHSHAPK
jgi:hypothetical protein